MASGSPNARGYTAALASAVILSTTSILIRFLTNTYGMPALILAYWRELFVAISLVVVLCLLHKNLLLVNLSHLPYLLLYGLILAIFNSLWTLSVVMNGAAVSTVLAYSSTAFTALLGRWLLKEWLDWRKGLAIVASMTGCLLVSKALDPGAWRVNLVGIITGILSGLGYAIYTLMGRYSSQRGLNPWTTLLFTFAFASVFLLGFNLVSRGFIPGTATRAADFFWLGNSWAGWGILILLAAGPTLAGFGLYNVALTHLPSSIVNLVATSEPVFTAIIAYYYLGERLTWIQVVGSLLILGTVVFLRFGEGRILDPECSTPIKSSDTGVR